MRDCDWANRMLGELFAIISLRKRFEHLTKTEAFPEERFRRPHQSPIPYPNERVLMDGSRGKALVAAISAATPQGESRSESALMRDLPQNSPRTQRRRIQSSGDFPVRRCNGTGMTGAHRCSLSGQVLDCHMPSLGRRSESLFPKWALAEGFEKSGISNLS